MIIDNSKVSCPKITVFTSHYNVKPEYLRRAVESILNQTFKDFEYIISDNCSTDGTAAILDEYAKNDGRIKVLHRKENHPGKSLENVIMNVAHGRYLVFLDNDDYYEPYFLEEMYKLQTNTGADLVACGTEALFESSSKRIYRSYHDLYISNYSKMNNILTETAMVTFATAWCKLFKLDIIKEVVRSEIFSEYHQCYLDTMICLAYALHSNSLMISSKIMHHYFVRQKSQISTWNRLQIDSANGTLFLSKQFLKKYGMYTQENCNYVYAFYRGSIDAMLEELNNISPDKVVDAFTGLSEIISNKIFFEYYMTLGKHQQNTFYDTILSTASSLISKAEQQQNTEDINSMYLYKICRPLKLIHDGNYTLSTGDLESYLKSLYEDENICKFGKQWLGKVIKAYNAEMFEIFSLYDTDFLIQNPSYLYALLRGMKQYPLIKGFKSSRLIQKYSGIVFLLLNKNYAFAFPLLLKSCDSNPTQQENSVLLEVARTIAALQNDAPNYLLASKRKAEFLIQQEKYEEAASLVLDLEEMLPKDYDIITYKVKLLVKTGRLAAAKKLSTEISSIPDISESFKQKICQMTGSVFCDHDA